MSEQNEIDRRIEEGDITSYQAAGLLSVVTAMTRELKRTEKTLRGYLLDHMDDRERLTTSFGEVTQKRGAQAKWRVTDPVKYAEWLQATGHEDMTVMLPMPVEDACKPDVIQALITANAGETPDPDAADLKGGTSDSVTVKPLGSLSEMAARNKQVGGDMMLALGMEPEEPEQHADVEDEEF